MYKNTVHHSNEMTPAQASRKLIEKSESFKLQDKRENRKSKNILGDLVRIVDIKRTFPN